MGLLDGILASALGGGAPQGANNPLIQMAGALLNNNSSIGGLAGLAQQAEQAGLGHVVQSWIGSGANLPISGDQLTQILGSSQVQQMAQQVGLNPQVVSGALAQILPHMVDHLTPGGQVPQGGVQNAIGMLGQLLGR
ncbi:MAG TPA: YidB family protein [Burkholderiaceae bacterium]|nr:YidB family protein [Burkholderiaceae bacterium]